MRFVFWTVVLTALVLSLTGALLPALTTAGWLAAFAIATLLTAAALWFFGVTILAEIAAVCAGLTALFRGPKLPEPPHGWDAPQPGSSGWLDWANRRGRHR